jgi:glycogen debranching enzyme
MLSNKAFVLAMLAVASVTAGAGEPTALRFSVPQGGVLNEFYRDGPAAAHLVLTSGSAPRLVIAFPAGNSGAAIWLMAKSAPLAWQPDVTIEPTELEVPGGVLHGITATLSATGGRVSVRQAITGSVRVIREYEDAGRVPADVMTAPRMSGRKVVWQRHRIDGAPGYLLSVEVLSGNLASSEDQAIEFSADAEDRFQLRVVALTGEAPLTPMAERDLVTSAAAPDPRLRSVLAYLSFHEKLLAGSWRFDTYFGRDTLMSLRLLSPVLKAPAMEAGLGSVLERLNAAGEVAHEEDIGEFAILQRLRAGLPPSDTPILDYKMVDDDFMLAPVAVDYLLETTEGRARASAFLAREMASGESCGSALVRNLRYVAAAATPFAQSRDWRRLVALKPGHNVGNWRDSEDGLGGGRYPYDVNAVFVPAALDAIARLRSSGLLQPYLDGDRDAALANASRMAEIWRREAPPLFDVEIPADAARAEVTAYARGIGLDPSPAIAALGGRAQRFRAVSLDAGGRPVPILVSDEAFALLFLDISSAEAERIVRTLMQPFPAGLLTDVGLLVANPAYAPTDVEPAFDRHRYHGTVIWSWQQAMLAAGVERQLRRGDLTASARLELGRARARLREVIDAAAAMRGSELWSWSPEGATYRLEPFGQRDEHETESNAAQLWSAVHLAR